MDGNRSQGIGSATVRTGTNAIFSDDYRFFANMYGIVARYSDLVIFPTIGVVGLVGNTLSGVIMVKDGLGKPSNVLLLGLAFADFCALLETINVPRLVMYAYPSALIWMMEQDSIFVCYYLSQTINFISNVGFGMSKSLTVFITLERVVAVYLPLRFPRLVTPKRATFVVILSFLISIPDNVITRFRSRLATLYNDGFGGWIGTSVLQTGWIGSGMEFYLKVLSNYFVPIIPTTIVSIGCVLIGVKVTITMRRRKNLTSSTRDRSSSATTRTLLMVSFFYSIVNVCWFFSFLPQLNNISNKYDVTYFMGPMFSKAIEFLTFVNSSWNFFVYAIFNPRLRKLMKQQFLCDFKIKKKQ